MLASACPNGRQLVTVVHVIAILSNLQINTKKNPRFQWDLNPWSHTGYSLKEYMIVAVVIALTTATIIITNWVV